MSRVGGLSLENALCLQHPTDTQTRSSLLLCGRRDESAVRAENLLIRAGLEASGSLQAGSELASPSSQIITSTHSNTTTNSIKNLFSVPDPGFCGIVTLLTARCNFDSKR